MSIAIQGMHDATLVSVSFDWASRTCVFEFAGAPTLPWPFVVELANVSELAVSASESWGPSASVLEVLDHGDGRYDVAMQSGDTIRVVAPNNSFKPKQLRGSVAVAHNRLATLEPLLTLTRPLSAIASDLSGFGWDAENPLVTLSHHNISAVLARFLGGELSASEIEDWANMIECRDDIDCSPDTPVGQALHELANPLLTCPLTEQSARAMVARLSGLQPNNSFNRKPLRGSG